jgi:hypothetical protein
MPQDDDYSIDGTTRYSQSFNYGSWSPNFQLIYLTVRDCIFQLNIKQETVLRPAPCNKPTHHGYSRTKYFLVKWHFFWDHVNRGDAKVSKIDTKLQDADYLTKGLPREPFESNRRRVQGW